MKCVQVLITEITTKILTIPVDGVAPTESVDDYAEAEAERMILDDEVDMTVDVDCDITYHAIGCCDCDGGDN